MRIAIYGKGGIGKSMVACNLSAAYAKRGKKVLLVGCDPKQDTSLRLIRDQMSSAMDMMKDSPHVTKDKLVTRGYLGIDCIECGGPKPGIGCAGRGITMTFSVIERLKLMDEYDVVIFDVLGDVVCGGFAAPLRRGFCDKAVIVSSDELMSIYAMNNILSAVNRYKKNGIILAGLVHNSKTDDSEIFKRYVKDTGLEILAKIPRSSKISDADNKRMTAFESGSSISDLFIDLSERIDVAIDSDAHEVDQEELR